MFFFFFSLVALTSGIIIEELIRESLGEDGHKAFIENDETE